MARGGRPHKPLDPKAPLVPRLNRMSRPEPEPFRPGTKAASAWALLKTGMAPIEVSRLLKIDARYVCQIKCMATRPAAREAQRKWARLNRPRLRAAAKQKRDFIRACLGTKKSRKTDETDGRTQGL